MGGAQPLAATMNGAAFLGVDVDESRIQRRVETRVLRPASCTDLDEALRLVLDASATRRRRSRSGWWATSPRCCRSWSRRGVVPDVLTDQTSAHDLRVGYIPRGVSLEQAAELRERDPTGYEAPGARLDGGPRRGDARPPAQGAVTFDYGNNLRGQVADHRGMRQAFEHPRVRARVHPAALLPGRRAVPLGRALRRPGGHRRDGRRGARDVPQARRRWPAGSARPARRSSSRGCRPGSAGSSTASGRRWGCGSTGW